MNRKYLETARLLIQVAPLIFNDDTFALKGGTAINLFLRDMPRLSVDLDLVFTDHHLEREHALQRINAAMCDAAYRLNKKGFETYAIDSTGVGETKLLIRRGEVEVKVEVNFVMRGTVYPVRIAGLAAKARDLLMADLELPVVSNEDLYGGKLVAALDRQHPRDLFDVMQLFAHEGITPGIRRAFVVYLACHNRPMHEVLFPKLRDIRQDFESTFKGMTTELVELDELLATRARLVEELPRAIEVDERAFLFSVVRNAPRWELLGIDHLHSLPGIRWKLRNLEQLARGSPVKFAEQYEALSARFSDL